MKMILVLMGCLYFFVPGPLAGMGMRVLAMLLMVRLVFDLPTMIRMFFNRQRVV